MGYPIYKLLRQVNKQYPNNGFINYIDVTEDIYDDEDPDKHKLIDEDLRDLINEALNETYIHIAKDEVFTFPTVPGQREYVLPPDCDLRDIQEVVRKGVRPPPPPKIEEDKPCTITFASNGGTGVMEKIEVAWGTRYPLPPCEFTPPDSYTFKAWDAGGQEYYIGETIYVYTDMTIFPIWAREDVIYKIQNVTPEDIPMYLHLTPLVGEERIITLPGKGGYYSIAVERGKALNTRYQDIYVINYYGDRTDIDLTTAILEDTTYKLTQHTLPPIPSTTTLGGD